LRLQSEFFLLYHPFFRLILRIYNNKFKISLPKKEKSLPLKKLKTQKSPFPKGEGSG